MSESLLLNLHGNVRGRDWNQSNHRHIPTGFGSIDNRSNLDFARSHKTNSVFPLHEISYYFVAQVWIKGMFLKGIFFDWCDWKTVEAWTLTKNNQLSSFSNSFKLSFVFWHMSNLKLHKRLFKHLLWYLSHKRWGMSLKNSHGC